MNLLFYTQKRSAMMPEPCYTDARTCCTRRNRSSAEMAAMHG